MVIASPESDVELSIDLLETEPNGGAAHFLASCRRWRWTDQWSEFDKAVRSSGLLDTLHLDPITRHSYSKPRGYPGDAVLLDYLYDFEGAATKARSLLCPGGAAVSQAVWNNVEAQSVRWRRDYLAREIRQAAANGLSVLSVAAGHMRELDILQAEPRVPVAALDQDASSLEVVTERHPYVTAHHTTIVDVLVGRTDICGAGLVYSAGLFDYLEDRAAVRLVRKLWDLTGVRLIVANFAPYPVNLGSMELVMDWHLTYRNESEMRALWELALPEGRFELEVFRDPVGGVVYTAGNRC